ncbi:MAG TPA: HDOD domain-containing protein [bacterium]|nr:HDOD domain-containing protein [bacterium]
MTTQDSASSESPPMSSGIENLDEHVLSTGLMEAISQGSALHADLGLPEDIKKALRNKLPRFLEAFQKLASITREDLVRWSDLGEIIESDEKINARLIHLINSPSVPIPGKVKSVSRAGSLLSTPRLLDLAVLVALTDTYDRARFKRIALLDMLELVRHSVLTGIIIRLIVTETNPAKVDSFQAFVAGALHDIGIYALVSLMPQTYQAILSRQSATKRSLVATEREVLGCDHAEVGGTYAALLGLPDPVIESIALHHQSLEKAENRLTAGLVALANRLANNAGVSMIPKAVQEPMELSIKDVVRDIRPEWARADVSTAIFVRHGERINVRLSEVNSQLNVLTDTSEFFEETKIPIPNGEETPGEQSAPESVPAVFPVVKPLVQRHKRRADDDSNDFVNYVVPGLHLIKSDEPLEGFLLLFIFSFCLLGLILTGGEIALTIPLVAGVMGAAVWNIFTMMRD